MKFLFVTGCAVLVGYATFMFNQLQTPRDPTAAMREAKVAMVEPETAVRPARFEEMKWHPGDAPPPATEVRAPASNQKLKKKQSKK